MACLQLDPVQARTLHDLGIYHPHPCVGQRAQALQPLARGDTLSTVATTFGVHLNNVENGARWWRRRGLVGLFQPTRPGPPPKWDASRQQTLAQAALQPGGSAHQLLDALGATDIRAYADYCSLMNPVSARIHRSRMAGHRAATPMRLNRNRIDSA